jgi:hypothetical protein
MSVNLARPNALEAGPLKGEPEAAHPGKEVNESHAASSRPLPLRPINLGGRLGLALAAAETAVG